jgi:alpha-galactosidase
LDTLLTLSHRQEAPSSPTAEVSISITPTQGQGFAGHPGISLSGSGDEWGVSPTLTNVESSNDHSAVLTCIDERRKVQIVNDICIDPSNDVICLKTQVKNLGEKAINLEWCASATLLLPNQCDQLIAFEGAWAKEFQLQHHQLQSGIYMRENRKGRTSHDNFPGFIVHSHATNEYQGEAYGFHLGWSGNTRSLVNQLGDGRRYAQLGELLLPGEVALNQGEDYQSPTLYASYTNEGLSTLSNQFHRYVRSHLITEQVKNKPRPVHYNTWEGLYFDHDMETLLDLADRASNLGVERFVLDDGWFIGRNNDKAGLGDWFIDEAKYPNGLSPLIEKVNSLGMEFGLWFEPEMVNPDSELYRTHPDWALSLPDNAQLPFRHQLVLDLTLQAVQDYLFKCIDELLVRYNIAYIKWDMNRDLNHPGNHESKPAVNQQTHAVYSLIARLKDKHPNVEIESCASGGARADYGVLQQTDRVWTSDSNDALERLTIQKGFSYFFPPELMGSHVGPRDCHITHRHIAMDTRAAVTLFGHMGMEMDLRELTELEQNKLNATVSLYKKHRALIHSGFIQRLQTQEHMTGVGVIADDKQEALFAYHLLKVHNTSLPGRFKLHGLDQESNYKLDIVWPVDSEDRWKNIAVFNFPTLLDSIDGKIFSGQVLCEFGIEMPLLTPQSSLIFHLTKQ